MLNFRIVNNWQDAVLPVHSSLGVPCSAADLLAIACLLLPDAYALVGFMVYLSADDGGSGDGDDDGDDKWQ